MQSADWLLGNFESTDEVRNAFEKIVLAGSYFEEMEMVPPIHFILRDARGEALLIELTAAGVKFYSDDVDVVTNEPEYPRQVQNFSDYLDSTSAGDPLDSIPGDSSRQSRFIRLKLLNKCIRPSTNLRDAIGNLTGIVGRCCVLPGEVVDVVSGFETATRWLVIRDHENFVYHYKHYQDQTLRCVNLKRLDFRTGTPMRSIPLEPAAEWCVDETVRFG